MYAMPQGREAVAPESLGAIPPQRLGGVRLDLATAARHQTINRSSAFPAPAISAPPFRSRRCPGRLVRPTRRGRL
jgi:hypothetical protein